MAYRLPFRLFSALTVALALLLSSCGSPAATATSASSATPDRCAPANIKTEAEAVHRFMREFDDGAAIAAVSPRNQVSDSIGDLQRIRRDAQDQDVPDCLARLKQLQLLHMNTVIQTLLAFLGGASQQLTDQGISLARQQHDAYTLELAHVIGLTIVVVTPTGAAGAAPSAPAPDASATAAPAAPFVTVPGPTTVNMRGTPSLEGNTLGLLTVGDTARVVGRTADGAWLKIEMPSQSGQAAWVYASLVTLTGSIDALAVLTPAP